MKHEWRKSEKTLYLPKTKPELVVVPEFQKIMDGSCVQMLHIGSYDDEAISFERMEEFAKNMDLIRKSKIHREIYLSDFQKVPTEQLKTVLRFQMEE